MDENEIKGAGKGMLGKIKDAVGGLTGDAGLQAEGKVEQVGGKVQKQFGGTADTIQDGVSAISSAASSASGKAGKTLGEASDQAGRAVNDFASETSDFTHRAGHYVERSLESRPALSLVGIAAIGYAAAFLIHSPSSPFTSRHSRSGRQ